MKIEVRFSDAVDSGIVTDDTRITREIASNLVMKGKAVRPDDARVGDGRWVIDTNDIEDFENLPTAEQREASIKAALAAEMERKKQNALPEAIATGKPVLYHWSGQVDGNGGTGYYVYPDGSTRCKTYRDE